MRPLLASGLVLAGVALLAGCTLFPQPQITPQQQPTPTNTNNQVNNVTVSSNGPGSFSISGQNGESQVTLGQKLPADWPSTMPMPRGATITVAGSEKNASEGTNTYHATLTSSRSVQELFDELKTAYAAAGWTISDESIVTVGTQVGNFKGTQGTNEVTVSILGAASTQAGENGITIVGKLKQ